ncbi:MAG TPA: hypothetical protein VNL14_16185 [Candidatus Acidoferrales bacterium]|nr:hypothetical protein [Candidatus Acidoferrales bacterium]
MATENEGAREESSSRLAEAAETAKAQAQEYASAAAERAREVSSRLGHKVREFASTLREKSPADKVRATTDKFAERLEHAGLYLEDRGFQGMIDDLTGLIRKYPMQTLLVGLGIGFLLSRRRR